MKKLFTSYSHSIGFGNHVIELTEDESLESMQDIKILQQVISKYSNRQGIIALNTFILPIGTDLNEELFISFATPNGFGNYMHQLKEGSFIEGIDDIIEIQKHIAEKAHCEKVIILNMCLLPIG